MSNRLIKDTIKYKFNSLLEKKSFLLFVVGLFLLNTAYCVEIDTITAKTVATNFYLSSLSQSSLKQSPSITNDIELVHQENNNSSTKGTWNNADQLKPLYYVFNVNDNNGFIIVSGDDRVTPVLGYSFTGMFSILDQPPAFKDWMRNYKKQIKYQIENDCDANYTILEEWSSLMSAPVTKSSTQINEVLPLLSTTWAQGCYYNELCPFDNAGPCNHAYAGCVAIAMAQIMKYWNHPVSSSKIYGYYAGPDYGCLPDIGTVNYNWSLMPDALSYESDNNEKYAVSELLYNAGVASLMDFGHEGSGAFSSNARNALISYFNFSSSIQYIERYIFTDDEDWENILRDELDNNRPVYYDGSGSGGHAFVCDGYQNSNYFHFNWGWSGILDGYYYVSDLTPGDEDFNDYQSAIIGISPGESQPDPFDNILEIEGCGSDYTQTFTGGGAGAWDISNCNFSTPGLEQVYSFVAPVTGNYSFEVVAASDVVKYSWREANCGEPGWRCIEGIGSVGTFGSIYWTAGTTYYILLDDVDLATSTHQFSIKCAVPTFPVIEYHSHAIDDDNGSTSSGDNDGLAEPGESIEMSVSLRNIGDGDAHNVSAVLSTSDQYISIGTANNNFGDISAGESALGGIDYVFYVSPNCPDRDVTFALEITSDEESWTNQFTVHVYAGHSNPCDSIISINGCGSEYAQTFTGGGSGVWNVNNCGFTTPGLEQVYSFIAPVTGSYSIEVAVTSGNVGYSWRASSCGETGWTCIDGITSSGTYGTISWTAGTTYYILLDDEDTTTSTHQFYIICPVTIYPIIDYYSHEIDDNNNTSSGASDGLAEPGESIGMPITLRNIGTGDAHSVFAVISTSDPYITISRANNHYGDISAGGSALSGDNYGFDVSLNCPERDVTFALEITSDEESWTDQFIVHVYIGHSNPCDSIISINDCGSEYAQTFTGGGSGVWNVSSCGYNAPGSEQVYQFVAPVSGTYSIEVTAADGYVDYSWKASSCRETGWTCIDDITSAGTYGTMPLTVGATYYVLLNDEDTTTNTHQFYINCLARPELEYFSHEIDDDNNTSSGDNDGRPEPGESIEMPIALRNIGTGDAHNVSAVLSTSDPYINISDATNNYGDISAGGNALCSGDYDFDISLNCPEKDVTFTLEITLDEGRWSDQFTVHVYNDNTSLSYIHNDTKLILYPNPANDMIYLKTEIEIDSQVGISIMDNMGRMVYSQSYPALMKDEEIEIDLSGFNSGMYFFQFKNSGLSKTKKIIKE